MSRWNPQPAYDRVMSRCHLEGECLIFEGRLVGGYGVIRDGERMRKAHRVVYEAVTGPIPDGLTVDHLCCRTSCVQPAHLQLVTAEENVSLAAERRGEGRARLTPCPWCGSTFIPRGRSGAGRVRWCSRECHTAWRRSQGGRTTYEYACEVCNVQFLSVKRHARTCGISCRGRLRSTARTVS